MSKQHDSQSHVSGHHRSASAPEEHKAHGPTSIVCGIITCSDTRTSKTDKSGQLIRELLTKEGHRIDAYHIIKDEPKDVQKLVQNLVQKQAIVAIIINGGTGISQRDSTFEAIDELLEKRLAGFGEIFRYLSYKDIGSSAILSRATAGLYQGKVIFSIPGSSGAVRLAMEALIIPELSHIVGEIQK